MNNDNSLIMKYLEEAYPNKLPHAKIDDFELGILVGQQMLIEKLKIKLNISNKLDKQEVK